MQEVLATRLVAYLLVMAYLKRLNDDNGNIKHSGDTLMNYNYDNMPDSIGTTSFVYDYAGQRVKKIAPGTTTIYIGKLYECTNGACSKHIYAGSQRVATKMSDGTTYCYHTDHLGSSTVITDQNGSIVEQIKYYGFGATRYQSGDVTDYKYTGQEYDPETGLYYYNARYYDPALGMFISADSVVPDPSSPQDLNRYVYAANNPLIYADPSGHFFEELLMGVIYGALIGGTTSAIMGEDIGKGMLTGGIAGALFYGAGSLGAGASAGTQVGLHVAAGGLAGAINSVITGGDVGRGAMIGGLSAGVAKDWGQYLPDGFGYQLVGRSVIGGVIGGAASEIYGGDFGEGFVRGAETAAIGYLANETLHAVNLQKMMKWMVGHAKSDYTGRCALHFRLGLEAGGADTTGHPEKAGAYGPFLTDRLGWIQVDLSKSYEPKVGDAAVFTPDDKIGHIQAWDGSRWVSDTIQPRFLPNRTWQNIPYTIYRQY